MKKKSVIPFILLFFMLNVSFAQANNVRSRPFTVYFPTASSIGFQHLDEYVLLTVTNGTINSSVASVFMNDGGGNFVFTANETASFRVTYTVSNVKVAGDEGNELRAVTNQSVFVIGVNDMISVIWSIEAPIWFPIGFIMGIVGLFSIFGGSLYLVNEVKQKNYEEGFQNGVIFMALGTALVLVWLWP